MSHSGKNHPNELGFDNLSVKECEQEANKPDFRELDLGSPVSPLRTRPSGLTGTTTTTTTTSSSSSSSGSVSGQARHNPLPRRTESSHSGELSDTSPTAHPTRYMKSGHNRSPDCGSTHHQGTNVYSGHHNQSSVNSPPVNVLPTGNICPSGRILKTGMGLTSNRSSRTDTLGSGSGLYGHGSIIRGGGGNAGGASQSSRGVSATTAVFPENAQANKGRGVGGGGDAEEVKRLGNELYRKGCFAEALSMYDRAIALAPANAAYRANRAAALTGLGRIVEAVKECEEAVRLDPSYWRAHQRLASLLIRSE